MDDKKAEVTLVGDQECLDALLKAGFKVVEAVPEQPVEQTRPKIHHHHCSECDALLVCVCEDRRQVERQTGKPRVFQCMSCWKLMVQKKGRK